MPRALPGAEPEPSGEPHGKRGRIPQRRSHEHEETRALVALVHDASDLVRARGETDFEELAGEGSHWRQGERYVFVLDPGGRYWCIQTPNSSGATLGR